MKRTYNRHALVYLDSNAYHILGHRAAAAQMNAIDLDGIHVSLGTVVE